MDILPLLFILSCSVLRESTGGDKTVSCPECCHSNMCNSSECCHLAMCCHGMNMPPHSGGVPLSERPTSATTTFATIATKETKTTDHFTDTTTENKMSPSTKTTKATNKMSAPTTTPKINDPTTYTFMADKTTSPTTFSSKEVILGVVMSIAILALAALIVTIIALYLRFRAKLKRQRLYAVNGTQRRDNNYEYFESNGHAMAIQMESLHSPHQTIESHSISNRGSSGNSIANPQALHDTAEPQPLYAILEDNTTSPPDPPSRNGSNEQLLSTLQQKVPFSRSNTSPLPLPPRPAKPQNINSKLVQPLNTNTKQHSRWHLSLSAVQNQPVANSDNDIELPYEEPADSLNKMRKLMQSSKIYAEEQDPKKVEPLSLNYDTEHIIGAKNDTNSSPFPTQHDSQPTTLSDPYQDPIDALKTVKILPVSTSTSKEQKLPLHPVESFEISQHKSESFSIAAQDDNGLYNRIERIDKPHSKPKTRSQHLSPQEPDPTYSVLNMEAPYATLEPYIENKQSKE